MANPDDRGPCQDAVGISLAATVRTSMIGAEFQVVGRKEEEGIRGYQRIETEQGTGTQAERAA